VRVGDGNIAGLAARPGTCGVEKRYQARSRSKSMWVSGGAGETVDPSFALDTYIFLRYATMTPS